MAYYVHEFIGNVIEIPATNKAIVEFSYENNKQRALLLYRKLKVNGQPVQSWGSIRDYLSIGTVVKFQCHGFDNTKQDRCGWYIMCAWRQDDRSEIMKTCPRISQGLYNCKGVVEQINKRQGFLSFNNKGKEEHIVFLASNVYLYGKRYPAKSNLNDLWHFTPGQYLMFDAVRCDPEDNKGQANWFALVTWKGLKPIMEYDSDDHQELPMYELSSIKLITQNPQSTFLCSSGTISRIIDDEYAMASCEITTNQFELVLFHRSAVILFDYCLEASDLGTIFEKGDIIYFVAAATPTTWEGPRWVASRVRVFMHFGIKPQLRFKK